MVVVRVAIALAALCLAGCDRLAGPTVAGSDKAKQDPAVPEADRLKILELQIEELRAELAAEKQTREAMNKELASAIDEVEAAVRASATVSQPAPLADTPAKPAN